MSSYTPRPELIDALIQQESGGNNNAVSRKGARGLAQVMPATARNPGFGVAPLQNSQPEEQRRFASDYLGAMLKKYNGDERLALAAYNAGPGAVDAHKGIPPYPETQNYVKKILGALNPISSAEASETPWKPPQGKLSFEEWKAQKQAKQPTQSKLSFEEWKAQKYAKQPQQESTGDYLAETAANIPSSFANYAGGIGNALLHPIDTTQTLLNLANSGLQAALPDSVNQFMHKVSPDTANNAGMAGKFVDYEKSRYGSPYKIAETFKNDPVGMIGDASLLLGGAGLVPGMAKAGKVGAVIEPINVAIKSTGKLLPKVGGVAGRLISEYGTHTGPDALNVAANSGLSGGTKLKDFADNLRGKADQAEIVPELKQALKNMRKADFDNYSRDIQGIKESPDILKFDDVNTAAAKAMDIDTYRGLSGKGDPINLNSAADRAKADVVKKLNDFKTADPAEFHTPQGFDALKRSIGKIDTPPGTPQRRVVDKVYNAVKDEIVKAYPEYGKIMEESSNRIKIAKEMERALSAGENAMIDTALRKLQSITRNNANTNYGSRKKLVEELNNYSESGNLFEKLSGQTLNTIKPRGLGGAVAGALGGYGLAVSNPWVLPLMAAQSPRIMGETAMTLGQMARYAKKGSKLADPKLMNLLHSGNNKQE